MDYKGRINPEMLMQYGGLYNKIQSRKSGLPAAREEEKEVAARVASVFSTYAYKRAPQFSSRSMSPYLLANSFNFDVTEILLEVKAAREKQLQEEVYSKMTNQELNAALKAELAKTEPDQELCGMIKAAS